MSSILEKIVRQKQKEVEHLKKKNFPFKLVRKNLNTNKSLKEILSHDELAIIGEIKRKSPSKGNISLIQDPMLLLDQYIDGGVAAISVLTDENFFSGSVDDLIVAAEYLKHSKIPILRKDFVIDEAQINESLCCGADAILLIVSVLKKRTKSLLRYANKLGIDAIVEVHNEEELTYAVEIGSEIIGINNRDLSTFKEDINVCLNLIKQVPKGIYTVAESSIKSPHDVKQVKAVGFDGVLIGECLVKAQSPADLIREMSAVR